MKKMLLGVLIGVVICGAGYMITHKNNKPVETTATVQETETKEEETTKEEPKEEKLKIDYSKSFITLNGKQYEIGLDSGKLRVPTKDDKCQIKSFQLNYNDDVLYNIMANPNMDYHPVWLTDGNDVVSAVAFLYKGEGAILRLETNKFRFAIGTEEITDKETLDKVAMSIFGEEYYWDALNAAIPRQEEIKHPSAPKKTYTNDFDKEVDEGLEDIMNEYDAEMQKSLDELELEKNIAEDQARKDAFEAEAAYNRAMIKANQK